MNKIDEKQKEKKIEIKGEKLPTGFSPCCSPIDDNNAYKNMYEICETKTSKCKVQYEIEQHDKTVRIIYAHMFS